MSYLRAIYLDFNHCCDEFVKGIELLEQCLVEESVACFQCAMDAVADNHEYYYKYQSYYGLASLLSGNTEAISHCRSAVLLYPFDGDVCMNLARAELFLRNRRGALKIIETGLRFSVAHHGLLELQNKIGVRKRNPIPILSRANPLNQLLGRCMRKKK